MEDLSKKTAVVILAGGRGERLEALTSHRAKPSVPFGGKFRIIDFVLSNCLESGFLKIVVPVQYKCQSLIEHMKQWESNMFIINRGQCLRAVSPQGITTPNLEPYLGTADAVYENLSEVERLAPKYDLVLSGDHIYQMDYREPVSFHMEKEAELTILARETIDRNSAKVSGVLQIDKNNRIVSFAEKPEEPESIPGKPGTYLISMGIYVFNHEIMVKQLTADANDPESKWHDFGKNIIPNMVKGGNRVFAFPFSGYWRDVGTVEAYFAAQMDLVRMLPEFNLYVKNSDGKWYWRTFGEEPPPTKIVFNEGVESCLISGGCFINRGYMANTVVSTGVQIGMDVNITNSVILDCATIGAGTIMDRAIVEKGCIIPPNSIIKDGNIRIDGADTKKIKSYSGIVLVPRHFKSGEEL